MRWSKPSASAVFAILMVLSFLAILLLPPGYLNSFRSAVNSLIAPSAMGMNNLLRYSASQQHPPSSIDTQQFAELYSRVQQLERQNIYLHMQWQQKVNEYAQAEHLRRSLLLESYSLIPANVYGQATPGRAVLLIDQGSAAGLENGFWVLGFPEGRPLADGWELLASAVLVGRIAGVQAYTAQVRLLGDPDDDAQPKMSVSLFPRSPVGDPQPWTEGQLYDVEPIAGGLLLAKDVPNNPDPEASDNLADMTGAAVVSYAMPNLPAGLAIGRVIKVTMSPRSMAFSDLTIEPLASTSRLHSVMVLRPMRPDD